MTEVTIQGEQFFIDGEPTYKGRRFCGHRIEGLLLNSRMVQATFDDANLGTRSRWAYPDTGAWDPERNVKEFLEALSIYREHGLLAVTVNLQGGSPEGYSQEQPWINTAFKADGSFKPDYLARMKRVLDRTDELGMVVILGVFYFGQDERLADEAAVLRALDNAVDWVLESGYRHVLLEVNNECDVDRYEHEILMPRRVSELIERVKGTIRGGRRLLVGTSFRGGAVPHENTVRASDFLLMHGNGVSDPNRIIDMVDQARAVPGYRPMPILFNEDDHFGFDRPMNNFIAGISRGASWGFFDPGANNYRDGFQSPPVQWQPNTERKKAFFQLVREITGSQLPQGTLGLEHETKGADMARIVYPGAEWERISPAKAGFDPAGLEGTKRWLDDHVGEGRYRAVVVRGGRVVAEWNHGLDRDEQLWLASATKSIFSCILGIAVEESRIPSADARVVDYYPEAMDVPEGEGPKPGRYAFEKDRGITFRQLISNTSGYMKPGEEPGKVFHYQTYGMNILTHAISKTYGLYDVRDPEGSPGFKQLVDEKLRVPIGASWGYYLGNFDLHPKARIHIFGYYDGVKSSALDMARLGWLWRNWGRWKEEQLIPEAWLREATRTAPDVRANCPQEQWQYGYAFWTNDHGQLWPSLPRDSYAASGAGSQHIWVCPSLDLVVVQSPGLWENQAENDTGLLRWVVDAIL